MHTSVINIAFPFDINCLLYKESIDTDRVQSYVYIGDAMRERERENFFPLDLTFTSLINQDRRQSVIFTLRLFHSFVKMTI